MGLISILPCSSTKLLYSLIRDYCSSTLLISIHDRTCIRPNRDHGIGFPILSSVDHVVPMLIDMRHDFLRKWDHINLIHDDTIGEFILTILLLTNFNDQFNCNLIFLPFSFHKILVLFMI